MTTTCPPPEGGSPVGRTAALIGVSALASLFLAACGGDSDSPVPPPAPAPTAAITEVPASAAASDAALESFAFTLALSDTTEPLLLDNVPTFPSSETEEPIPTP
jgi:hypothetical protein